jgi:hypothetical protein
MVDRGDRQRRSKPILPSTDSRLWATYKMSCTPCKRVPAYSGAGATPCAVVLGGGRVPDGAKYPALGQARAMALTFSVFRSSRRHLEGLRWMRPLAHFTKTQRDHPQRGGVIVSGKLMKPSFASPLQEAHSGAMRSSAATICHLPLRRIQVSVQTKRPRFGVPVRRSHVSLPWATAALPKKRSFTSLRRFDTYVLGEFRISAICLALLYKLPSGSTPRKSSARMRSDVLVSPVATDAAHCRSFSVMYRSAALTSGVEDAHKFVES